jgi:hypothetical protein
VWFKQEGVKTDQSLLEQRLRNITDEVYACYINREVWRLAIDVTAVHLKQGKEDCAGIRSSQRQTQHSTAYAHSALRSGL